MYIKMNKNNKKIGFKRLTSKLVHEDFTFS